MNHGNKGFSKIILDNHGIERLATNFQFTEGPVWTSTYQFLLFSDIPANRIYRWFPKKGIEVFREPSFNSNGLAYDVEGHLLVCEHGKRRLSQIQKNGTYLVLVDRYKGKKLNSPNDVVVRSDGIIYFTDPPYGITPEVQELQFNGVFCFSPRCKETVLLAQDFSRPNGLAFSPDEKNLYIADTWKNHIKAFDVEADGTLDNGRIFVTSTSKSKGHPDGIKVDIEGNLYAAAEKGIWIVSPEGTDLGLIEIPERPANLAWGGKEWKTLYITARTSLYCVRLRNSGTGQLFL